MLTAIPDAAVRLSQQAGLLVRTRMGGGETMCLLEKRDVIACACALYK